MSSRTHPETHGAILHRAGTHFSAILLQNRRIQAPENRFSPCSLTVSSSNKPRSVRSSVSQGIFLVKTQKSGTRKLRFASNVPRFMKNLREEDCLWSAGCTGPVFRPLSGSFSSKNIGVIFLVSTTQSCIEIVPKFFRQMS